MASTLPGSLPDRQSPPNLTVKGELAGKRTLENRFSDTTMLAGGLGVVSMTSLDSSEFRVLVRTDALVGLLA